MTNLHERSSLISLHEPHGPWFGVLFMGIFRCFLFLKIIESIDYITGKIWRNMTVESNRIT